MEILLIACMLAYVAGAQSEQSKLGVSPAQRAQMREETRHKKAVQKIAEKHGGAGVPSRQGGTSPWKEPPERSDDLNDSDVDEQPGTFSSGYRAQRPARPPFAQRVGERTGRGVTWAQDTGRDAWRAYRERRKREGRDGPELTTVPYPPAYPPAVPPVPTVAPPSVGGIPEKPNAPPTTPATDVDKKADDKAATKPDAPAPEALPPESATAGPDSDKTAEKPDAHMPRPETAPEPEAAKADLDKKPEAVDTSKPADVDATEPAPTAPDPEPQPADTPQGVGRMAAEVSYDSVMDESDELSAMCDDDLHTYDRIKKRAEREVGRGDTLATQVLSTGFGATIHAIVVRCREQYQVIHDAIDDLKANTVAQHEAVITAKDLLQRGQGVYADIAKDMEDVAERDAYISDAVDAEDTNAESEHYETKAAA